ncbi:MAG: gliding motility protein GldM [Bacteroidetes bacterium]|nr:gliding motility protein GldM [Bacteroidota bacterium]
MSIPKEPRQLMINLMYIVLTALLALNVSAEVMQAFFTMDKSLQASNQIVEHSNQQLKSAIRQQTDVYEQFQPYLKKVENVQHFSEELYNYLDSLKEMIITSAGGLDEKNQPKRKTDKDICTRLLVEKGKGEKLRQIIISTRKKLLEQVDDEEEREILEKQLLLKIDPLPKGSDKKNWAQFTFQQMPVAAVLPVLSKFQSDVRISETAILNHFFSKLDSDFKPDAYEAVIASEKSYLTKGEEFRGEIFLASYSSSAENISVSVDGRPIPVKNGKAVFTSLPASTGTKKHEMVIQLTNPVTGESKSFNNSFSYEVGEQSVTVSAENMNVLYIGVDNPIAVSVAGAPSEQVKVRGEGIKLKSLGNSRFHATSERPGLAKITVSGGGLLTREFEFRVKRIPSPTVFLGDKNGGLISANEMKVYDRITPVLKNFEFNARCKVGSFEMVRAPRSADVQIAQNNGGKFNPTVKAIINKARRGDVFYFDKIKVKCPGDIRNRKVNGMIFTIK